MVTDFQKADLITKISELLYDYDYDTSDYAIRDIVDTWADNKSSLIEMFKKHPNYVEGEFLIAFTSDFQRECDPEAIEKFSQYILRTVHDTSLLNDAINEKRIAERVVLLPNDMYYWIVNNLSAIQNQFITEEQAYQINVAFPDVHAHSGQKTSRVVNKIMTYIGYNKEADYNREFAKYADTLNPLTIKRHTILSVNPLDYYTMSFGNSWASCHTIDKENLRGMPNNYRGCYSSGTESYMLDGTSMVFYTVEASYDGNEYYTQPKVNRQMFHFGQDKLIQSRLYPQSNDSDPEVYTPYRNIVQKIFADILEIPNLWSLSRGTDNASHYITTSGTHYADYHYFANCTLSRIKDSHNENHIYVGHHPICPNCGDTHNYEENICCRACAGEDYYTCCECGCRVDEDEAYWIGEQPYCCDCAGCCDMCDSWVSNSHLTWIESENRYVCDECLSEFYTYCDQCEQWVRADKITYVKSDNYNVCDECLSEDYTKCDECGEYFRNNDIYPVDGHYYCSDCLPEDEEEENETV